MSESEFAMDTEFTCAEGHEFTLFTEDAAEECPWCGAMANANWREPDEDQCARARGFSTPEAR